MTKNEIKQEIDKKNWEINIFTEIQSDIWKKAQEDSLRKIAKKEKIKINGFSNPEKAPLKELRKVIANETIFQYSVESIVQKALEAVYKEVDKNVLLLDKASYSIDKISDNDLTIKFTYPIYPDFKIKGYDKLPIKFDFKEADSKQIDSEIEKLRDQNSMMIEKEADTAKVAKDDVVNIDYKGYIDDKAFENGEAKAYDLEIGSNSFIDNFEEQLINHKKGDEFVIFVTFPKTYHKEEMADKKAKFEVKINKISVKEKPAINDDLASLLNSKEVNNLKELKAFYKNLINGENEEKARTSFKQEAIKFLQDNNEVPVPRLVLMRSLEREAKAFEDQLKQYNLTIDKYIEALNTTKEKLSDELSESTKQKLIESLIFTQISNQEKIDVTEAEYEKEYEKLSKLYNMKVEDIKPLVSKEQLQISIVNNKILDILIKNIDLKASGLKTKEIKKEKKESTSTPKTKIVKESASTLKSKSVKKEK